MQEFAEQAKKHFEYLIDEYGFSVGKESYDPESFGNSLVEFQSSNATVMIVLDRGQVLIDIGPYPEVSRYQFGLSTVVEFLAPEADELAYIFPDESDDYREIVGWQIARLARILKQYCVPVLRGQFSKWEEMYEFAEKKALDKYRTITGMDPVQITSKRAQKAVQMEMERRRRGTKDAA